MDEQMPASPSPEPHVDPPAGESTSAGADTSNAERSQPGRAPAPRRRP